MPLFDFKCPTCNTVREVLIPYSELKTREVRCNERVLSRHEDSCNCKWCTRLCGTVMEAQPSSPASFRINGFNSLNHYGAKQMDQTFKGSDLIGARGSGIKVTTHEAS